MIPIDRTAEAPAVLRTRGAAQRTEDCAAHDAGTRSFDFDKGIYNGTGEKDALVKMQASKCAFCESSFRATYHGDVEHYRPKGGIAQNVGDSLTQPGYYWLAYEWTNLFLACAICNQSFKKNLFPLRDPARRARSHHDDIAQEEPLLLDPCRDDPRSHIGFNEGVPHALSDSPAGLETIRVLGLDRPELVEKRRKALRLWDALRTVIAIYRAMEANGTLSSNLQAKLAANVAHVAELVAPAAEYSAMAAAFFASPC